jgi:RNA polymerase sigma-70 factor (ECF subfamily)
MVGGVAQDISQEALWAWCHALVFDRRRASVRTWILTTSRYVPVDALRVRRPILTDPAEGMWASLTSGAASREDKAKASGTRARISAVVASLPAELSRALALAAVHGYMAAEISKVEPAPLGTSKARVHRGLQKWRASASSHDRAGRGAVL